MIPSMESTVPAGSVSRPAMSAATPATSAADIVRLAEGILWESEAVDWRARYVSENLREITGYDPDDWVRIREFWEDRVHPEDRAGVIQEVDRCMQHGQSGWYEYRWRVADGSYRRFRDRFLVVEGSDGERHLAGMMVDCTDEAGDRDRLRATTDERDRLQASLEQTSELLIVSDPVGVITFVNSAYEQTMGITREEVVGKSYLELGEAIPRSLDASAASTLADGQAWSGEMRARTKGGRALRLLSSVVPVRDASGTVTMMMAVHHDVTLVRELDAQQAQAAKLEAVGQLAGGVAHDFNNILTVILGYVRFIAEDLPDDSPIQDDLHQIAAASERAQRLTSQLLAFGRRSVLAPEAVAVGERLAAVAPSLAAEAGTGIELVVRGPAGEAFVDPGELHEAVANLVRNARNAMPDGGRIEVVTEVREGDGDRGTAPGSRWVVVRVRDTGSGIAPEVLPRIFEPFFTTGRVGEGSGLGLPAVDGFARQSGGHVRVDSTVGEGSTFELWLPEYEGGVGMEEVAGGSPTGVAVAAGAPSRVLTVLVAEDEAVVRAIVRRCLVSAGHRVLLASSGDEALDVAARFDGPIDVLLSDVVMPGIRGPELADRLRVARPGIRVVLASGFTEDEVTRRAILASAATFLPKPYSMETLLAAVEA